MTSKTVAVEAAAKAVAESGPSRRMHFPYTYTAKFAQFPYKFHFQNQPLFRYLVFGFIASVPIFWKIQKLACCPENKRKWEEIHDKARNAPPHWEH